MSDRMEFSGVDQNGVEKMPLQNTMDCDGYQSVHHATHRKKQDTRSCGYYEAWVCALLSLTYVFNQMDRLVIGVVTTAMAQDIGYGDLSCVVQASGDLQYAQLCSQATNNATCSSMSIDPEAEPVCVWTYNGQGIQYELLVGPVFNIVFATSGVFLGFAADYYNRKYILVTCSLVWSIVTILTGTATTYTELVLFRFILGIAEAGCTPFAASLLGDFFAQSLLGTAIGIYNWGVDIGYSLAFVVGDWALWQDIGGEGWRWAFYICGSPGILVGLLMCWTLVEPPRSPSRLDLHVAAAHPGSTKDDYWCACGGVLPVLRQFMRADMMLLCLAAAIRKSAQWVWTYNAELFYESQGQSAAQIGTYMAWIPALGGAVSLLAGGYISDRVARKGGLVARVSVIIVSQMLSVPFGVATLLCPPPYSYYMLLPCMMTGEMWVGITLALVVEMVPSHFRTAIVAVFLFVVNNVAGLGPILVPLVQDIFEWLGYTVNTSFTYSLLVLFPGGYVIAAIFYLFAFVAVLVKTRREKLLYL